MAVRKKLLIVEDDKFTRFMMKKIIQTLDLGLEVDVADDGRSGCERIENDPDGYALVLMDIHMPTLSGLEATKRIRDNANDPPNSIPIIAVTADAKYLHPLAVEPHGMDGFLEKPISPGGLIELIDKYCGPSDAAEPLQN